MRSKVAPITVLVLALGLLVAAGSDGAEPEEGPVRHDRCADGVQ
jgi:hypothetical protein